MKNRLSKSRYHPLKRKQIFKTAVFWRSRIKKISLCLLPIYSVLSLLFVSQGIPAIANQSLSVDPNLIVQQNTQPSALLEQGKIYYQAGQFARAVSIWEEALKYYQPQTEIISKIQVFNYLALAYKDLGKLNQAQAAIENSINLLKTVKSSDDRRNLLLGQALNVRGTIELLQGQTETALDTWKQATATYERAGDRTGKLIGQINQVQALQVLGQYRQAKSLLEHLIVEVQAQPDDLLKAQGLRSLGITLQSIGDLIQSKAILEQSWEISQKLNSITDVSAALFAIGNIARDLQQYAVAWTYYQEAGNLSPDRLTQVNAEINQLSMLVNLQKWEPALVLIPTIETKLAELPATRSTIYAKINFANILLEIEPDRIVSNHQKTAQLLVTAIEQARQLRDRRAEANSLYQLGKLYQKNGQLTDAKNLTEQALKIARDIDAGDINARVAAQLGAILKQQNNVKDAIEAYEIAFNNLQAIRSDLVANNREAEFDFREKIEPIYRDLVSLLLTPDRGEVSQVNLKQARQVMEALQLAELDNYFQDACLDTRPVVIDEIDLKAAVIYPIILPDRLETLLSIPNQPLRHYTTQLSREKVENTLQKLYSSLSPGYPRDEQLQLSQEIYNWLIAPAAATLQSSNIKTLVFVPDGFLRNLPMASLYDGKQYLIEKYSVVLSPGLQLFPQGLPQKNLSVLAAGLTESRQGFNALPGVNTEIKEVAAEIKADVLLDRKFTQDTFKKAIETQNFPIIHLATHGQFSSNPEETFLLTWSDRISITDFDLLFQKRRLGLLQPIELLVLSACQTAAGDNRATLGLAGFALRSGAKSTIASLWSVSDESTSSLMGEFYHQLSTGKVSKAEALRQAQLKVMANPLYKHPYFWSAFVLIGNWL